MSEKVHASPTKDFFVKMITRDIKLEDCILDLLDNSIDGAHKVLFKQDKKVNEPNSLKGFAVSIEVSNDSFSIVDNCGGISLSDAIDYAFHFGRRQDAPKDTEFSIGLYGIGMKRAIFKIGQLIRIDSTTPSDAFAMKIDVNEWLKGY